MTSTHNETPFDVIVVGGSYAGMSAALQLARASRRVLVIDSGAPRNEAALHAHGFLGQEGRPPAEIRAAARAELLSYPTVTWRRDTATDAARLSPDAPFNVTCADGGQVQGMRLVLAHGVRDILPPIEGLAERWGRSVFHCPYCHAYEYRGRRIGVIAALGKDGTGQARLLADWGHITLFAQSGDAADPLAQADPDMPELELVTACVRRIIDTATVELDDGRQIEMDVLFVAPEGVLSSPLAQKLGCSMETADCITTDSAKQTTVEGVFACGDCARMAGSIALSVGEGALAGVAVHRSLLGLL